MLTERTLQGTHTDAVGPYSLQISDYSIYEFLWHYVTVILKILFLEFPSKIHSMFSHYPRCRTKSHTYRECYVRNAVKYCPFVADSFSPCHSCLLTATESLYVTPQQQKLSTSNFCMWSDYETCLSISEFRRIIGSPGFM